MSQIRDKMLDKFFEAVDPLLPRSAVIPGLALALLSISLVGSCGFYKIMTSLSTEWLLFTEIITFLTALYIIGLTIIATAKSRKIEKERDKVIISIKHTHRDIRDFEKMYNRQFPLTEGNPTFTEQLTWIKGTDSLKGRYKKGDVLDFLLLARINSVVCGYLIVTYYYGSDSYAFISYLMVDGKTNNKKTKVKIDTVSDEIANYLRDEMLTNQLNGCIGIVAEVDKKDRRVEGKIRDFESIIRQSIDSKMWSNRDFPYLQPHDAKEDIFEIDGEREMYLCYSRTKKHPDFTSKHNLDPPPTELKEILNYLYKTIYWDSCKDDQKLEIRYREYLTKLHHKVLSDYERKIGIAS